MEDLLPYYERELAFLRRYSREFAQRYPKIAGRLLMVGEASEDPHVERLIEAFALMGARISKKLEDDYPEFTESLLEVLYPHYLRPFPSCSIAHFQTASSASQLSKAVTVERGTELMSRPVRGVPCRLRTAYKVVLSPLVISEARFHGLIQAPSSVSISPKVVSQITVQFNLQGDVDSLAKLGLDKIRVFIDGEPSMCSALRDALLMNVHQTYIEPSVVGARWRKLAANPFSLVGVKDDEALIDVPARSHSAYRLLTEFFAFPEKFGFFDIDLSKLGPDPGRVFKLHLMLSGISADSTTARIFDSLNSDNFKLGCTPVVNLFKQQSEPIHVSNAVANYPVVPDARRAWAYEVHSIDQVACVREDEHGESIIEYRPFYSMRHGETPGRNEQYWTAHRNEFSARRSPGFEVELSMVDLDFDPVTPHTDVLSCSITCTNRDLPSNLAYRTSGGDLVCEGGTVAQSISLLRKPTHSYRFATGRGAHWRLISHLALNHVSLVDGGAGALREMLRLYDLPRNAISAAQIDGIVSLEQKPENMWLPGKPFGTIVRGSEIRIGIDQAGFVGTGIHAFAHVMDHFFGLYVHVNSFTRLILTSSQTGEELIKCPPRSGESILV